MNTSAQPFKDWQGWLDLFREIYSTRGFLEFIDVADDTHDAEDDSWSWMTSYMIPVQTSLCSTMLLACLQLPAEQIEKTLASIARSALDQRFEKTPHDLKKKWREPYQNVTREMTRIIPTMAEMVAATLKCYVRGDYDLTENINLKMRQAVSLFASRNRTEAFQIVSQAGAAALAGSPLWDGWLSEASGEFDTWVLAIIVLRNVLGSLMPLPRYVELRQNVNDVSARLLENLDDATSSEDENEAEDDAGDDSIENEMLPHLKEIAEMCMRTEPFTDDEIREMGDKYTLFGDMVTQSIAPFLNMAEEDENAAGIVRLFVIFLGLLRYPEPQSIQLLIMLASGVNDQVDDEIIDEAVKALQRIGPPALPRVFDFVRYSSREDARIDMLKVLGAAGRGSDEVFEYLVKSFTESVWLGDKVDYVLPLALTHDPRAIGYIAEALREPGLGEDDAWELLDALQELEVTFYVNYDNRSVNIPDYGVIEDVLPRDWHTRKEIEEEEEEWDEDWPADDPLALEEDADDDDDAVDDEVVYDKNGVPRCPDCGAEMHFVDGAWVHEHDLEEPKSPRPQIKPVGRNDPCPCGSGKKYKYCHGRSA